MMSQFSKRRILTVHKKIQVWCFNIFSLSLKKKKKLLHGPWKLFLCGHKAKKTRFISQKNDSCMNGASKNTNEKETQS